MCILLHMPKRPYKDPDSLLDRRVQLIILDEEWRKWRRKHSAAGLSLNGWVRLVFRGRNGKPGNEVPFCAEWGPLRYQIDHVVPSPEIQTFSQRSSGMFVCNHRKGLPT